MKAPEPVAASRQGLRAQARRAWWLRQLYAWHWISSALCLTSLMLFTLTGITLNHSAQIKSRPVVVRLEATLPGDLRETLARQHSAGGSLPPALRAWLASRWSLRDVGGDPEWSEDEVYLPLPRPGGDAWLSVELDTGLIRYERTDRGWIAYLDDLHKGRNAGVVWPWFIDAFAAACLVFASTGLLLLKMHSTRRRMTWPTVGLGLLLPLLLALFFVH